MILLDTNVISEMMKPSPSANVMNWINYQEATQLFLASVTIAEIAYGIHALPIGNRREKIEDSFNKATKEAFKHRILSFDEAAGYLYGKLMGKRKELGGPLSSFDGQIAAIALSQNMSLATRNVKDFADCGLNLINPFESK